MFLQWSCWMQVKNRLILRSHLNLPSNGFFSVLSFWVNSFEECFCRSQGHQLKPIKVKVALPRCTFPLICNMHILCAVDPMSLNCISFALVEARNFLHMNIYLVDKLWMSICWRHLGSNKPTVWSDYGFIVPPWHACPGLVH